MNDKCDLCGSSFDDKDLEECEFWDGHFCEVCLPIHIKHHHKKRKKK